MHVLILRYGLNVCISKFIDIKLDTHLTNFRRHYRRLYDVCLTMASQNYNYDFVLYGSVFKAHSCIICKAVRIKSSHARKIRSLRNQWAPHLMRDKKVVRV